MMARGLKITGDGTPSFVFFRAPFVLGSAVYKKTYSIRLALLPLFCESSDFVSFSLCAFHREKSSSAEKRSSALASPDGIHLALHAKKTSLGVSYSGFATCIACVNLTKINDKFGRIVELIF